MPDSMQLMERGVFRTAQVVTRRRFLSRLTGGAAVLTAAGAIWRPGMSWAECIGTTGPYSSDRICGPSPYCNSSRCYSSGACYSTSYHSPRGYGGSTCIGSGEGYRNCWCVCKSRNLYRCCDCCANTSQGAPYSYCSGCGGGTWYRCICRGRRCSDCC